MPPDERDGSSDGSDIDPDEMPGEFSSTDENIEPDDLPTEWFSDSAPSTPGASAAATTTPSTLAASAATPTTPVLVSGSVSAQAAGTAPGRPPQLGASPPQLGASSGLPLGSSLVRARPSSCQSGQSEPAPRVGGDSEGNQRRRKPSRDSATGVASAQEEEAQGRQAQVLAGARERHDLLVRQESSPVERGGHP